MSVLILERLDEGRVVGAFGQWVTVDGEAYWPCRTRISGEVETWLAPMAVWTRMVGPLPPADFVSDDMCSIVPETVGGTEAWVACFVHDAHYALVGRGELSRWMADVWFSRNAYREVKARGGGDLRARVAQARAWGTNLLGWLSGPARIPVALLLAVGLLWWARACAREWIT